MLRNLIFSCLLFCSLTVFAQNYTWVAQPNFDDVGKFQEGFMATKYNNRWGFVNAQGNWKIPPMYAHVTAFTQGYALAKDTLGKICLLDKTGSRFYIDNQAVLFVLGASNNIITLEDANNNKYWYKKGIENFTEFKVDEVTNIKPFMDGMAAAQKNKLWGFVDTSGNWVIAPKFKSAENFSEGLSLVQNDDYYYGFIDRQGNYILPATYYYAASFSEGLAAVNEIKDEKSGFINKKGQLVIPLIYYSTDADFKNGIAAASFYAGDLYYYFIKKDGATLNENILMPAQNYGYQFSKANTYRIANNKTNYAIIDNKGNYLIKFNTFYDIAHSDTCIYAVKQNSKWGLINVANSKPLEAVQIADFEYDNKQLAGAFATLAYKAMEQRNYKDAETYLTNGINLIPNDVSLYMARTICRVVIKKWKSANEDMEMATRLEPGNPNLPDIKSMLTNNMGNDVTMVDYAKQMKAEEESKNYSKAIALATEAINNVAPAAFLHVFRARMYYFLKEQNLAEKDIEIAANLDPTDAEIAKYYEAIKQKKFFEDVEQQQKENLAARKIQFETIVTNCKKSMCWSCLGKGTQQVISGYTSKTSTEDVWQAQSKVVNTSTGSVTTNYGFTKTAVTSQVPNYKTVSCDKCSGKGTDGIHISKEIRRQYADVIKAFYPAY